MHSAARTYFTLIHPELNQPDPLNVHIEFLCPVYKGPVYLTVTLLKTSARTSTVQINIYSALPTSASSSPTTVSSPDKLLTTALVLQSNLSLEHGVSLYTQPIIPKTSIPNRETECEPYPMPEFLFVVAPMFRVNEYRILKGGKDGCLPSERFGPNVRETWIRRGKLYDGLAGGAKGWSVLSLGHLVDAVSFGFSFLYSDCSLGSISFYFVITLIMSRPLLRIVRPHPLKLHPRLRRFRSRDTLPYLIHDHRDQEGSKRCRMAIFAPHDS